MISPLRIDQLADRISLAARLAGAGEPRVTAESIARGELPPVPDAVPPLPPPTRTAPEPGKSSTPEYPLDEVANMLPRARRKITVSEKTPTWLRPFYRNQGGFNHILLETLERLLEANRQLQRQNHDLRGQLVAMSSWMNTVTQASGENRDWMLAAENRLKSVTSGRLVELEARLAALEKLITQPPQLVQAGLESAAGSADQNAAPSS